MKRTGQVTGLKEAKRTPERWRLPRVFDQFTLKLSEAEHSRGKGDPSPGVDGSTGGWKTMENMVTMLGCWGLRL